MKESQDRELTELKDRCAWHVQKVLTAKPPDTYVFTSSLFAQCGRGLRPSDWTDVLTHLCETGVCATKRSARTGTPMLALVKNSASVPVSV